MLKKNFGSYVESKGRLLKGMENSDIKNRFKNINDNQTTRDDYRIEIEVDKNFLDNRNREEFEIRKYVNDMITSGSEIQRDKRINCNQIPCRRSKNYRRRTEASEDEEYLLRSFVDYGPSRNDSNLRRAKSGGGAISRKNCTIGFNDYLSQPMRDLNDRFSNRRSVQNLTSLEIDRILKQGTYPPTRTSRRNSNRRISRRYQNEVDYHDSEERIAMTLARLNRSLSREIQGSYPPGRVHYEREYRIYGKDTVALIYYKTCYL